MKRIVCVVAAVGGLLYGLLAHAGIEQAQTLMEQGRHREALIEIDRVLKTEPDNVEARFLKGVILTSDEQLDRAAEVFTGLTREYPDLPEPYNNLAVIYAVQGEYEKAREALMSAIRTHPSYATAHENLGDIYARMASAAYDRALKLDSDNRSAQAKLAMVNDLFSLPEGNGGKEPPPAAPPPAPVAVAAPPPPAPPPVAEAPPPAPPPAPVPAVDQAALEEEITQSVRDWAKSWSAKDVDGYLSHYAPSFRPADGKSRKRWEAVRRQRLTKPKFIQVGIDAPRVRIDDATHASITFRQSYTADRYSDVVSKTLRLARMDGHWLITSEVSAQ